MASHPAGWWEPGQWVRLAGEHGEIVITDRGRKIAKMVPWAEESELPYFAARNESAEFRALSGQLGGGTDVTKLISDDRDGR